MVEKSRLQYFVRFPLPVPLPRLPVVMVHYREHQLRDVHHNVASDAKGKLRHWDEKSEDDVSEDVLLQKRRCDSISGVLDQV